MELNNLNIDSRTASWFLLTLFYKTERKYTCTKDKTLQLLTIMALDYANNGDKLFNEEILRSDNGGAYIQELMWLSNNEYIGMNPQNDDKEYIHVDLDESKNELVPFIYRCSTNGYELRGQTIELFRRFGSYPQDDLITMISPILDGITNEDKTIDLTKVSSAIDEINENDITIYLKRNNKRLIKTKK